MFEYDICFCANSDCTRTECRRHMNNTPKKIPITMSLFDTDDFDKCEYYLPDDASKYGLSSCKICGKKPTMKFDLMAALYNYKECWVECPGCKRTTNHYNSEDKASYEWNEMNEGNSE